MQYRVVKCSFNFFHLDTFLLEYLLETLESCVNENAYFMIRYVLVTERNILKFGLTAKAYFTHNGVNFV